MPRILVIGGSDAGISAALAAREQDPGSAVTLITADAYPNFSVCGLPFYLGGEVADWHQLAHRTREEITAAGITLRLETRALRLDPAAHAVEVREADGHDRRLTYDRLVVATGAEAVPPPVPGLTEREQVFFLHDMGDGLRLATFLADRKPVHALVVGAGYIGLEMTEAFRRRGLAVTLIEQAPTVLPGLDAPLARELEALLRSAGVTVVTATALERLEEGPGGLVAQTSDGQARKADLALIAAGVRPRSTLAVTAGAQAGVRGAIRVDAAMATGLPDVYAAGDCVETWHRLLQRAVYLPLGTTAHKQGRVAGINAAGGSARFAGSLGTQVLQVFGRVAGRTGLNSTEAAAEGWSVLSVSVTVPDHKAYYPGAEPLTVRLIADRDRGRLLGAQLLGGLRGGVATRLDILAAALTMEATVGDLLDLDLAYTPPLSSPWDPVQLAAQAWLAARR
ncbi:MAG: FAD-dependent oxidoreductase [Firmicutes bacterium]|nr:FAD-dependent oxidoreductase [Bacillota bacterium]